MHYHATQFMSREYELYCGSGNSHNHNKKNLHHAHTSGKNDNSRQFMSREHELNGGILGHNNAVHITHSA